MDISETKDQCVGVRGPHGVPGYFQGSSKHGGGCYHPRPVSGGLGHRRKETGPPFYFRVISLA